MKQGYLKNGTFFLGVNYWASHSGINMWRDWEVDKVDDDLKKISACGIKVVRVFPVWSEFQPLKQILGWGGQTNEIRITDDYIDKLNEEEKVGISKKCIEEFDVFCDLADKYGIKLIVPLITGWMSGRCFFPDAFIGKNVVTDPVCLQWEVRFVKYFVTKFKNKANIIAWELGNECNCLARVESREQAWLWSNTISSAVRVCDNTRPFISGMHSLSGDPNWWIEDQSELCDILTVHPYVLFTPRCDYERLVSPRAILHSPAEATYYSDIGGKDCLIEEIGSLGPVFGDEETVSDFVRANLFNAFANNKLGFLWWTAFDQNKFTYAPYEWCDVERELGLFDSDKKEKEAVSSYRKFADFISRFPYEVLPERERNGVCIVSSRDWCGAFGAYMLSKRAGIELKFASNRETLPDSEFYVVTGIYGTEFFKNSILTDLKNKIRSGATVLISYDGGTISSFEELVGCVSKGRVRSNSSAITEIDGQQINFSRSYYLDIKPVTAEVLLTDNAGKPLLVCNEYGKGNVLFFNACLESDFCNNVISSTELPYQKIYDLAYRYVGNRIIEKSNVLTCLTIHKVDDGYIVIAINNTEISINESFKMLGFHISEIYYGNIDVGTNTTVIPKADAVVFKISKK